MAVPRGVDPLLMSGYGNGLIEGQWEQTDVDENARIVLFSEVTTISHTAPFKGRFFPETPSSALCFPHIRRGRLHTCALFVFLQYV